MLDSLVVGGGYVGLAAAVAIKQAAPHLRIEVIETTPAGEWEKDERASAIIPAAVSLLERLGAWDGIRPDAQPILRMVITDSRAGDSVRPVFLTFDGESAGDGLPLAYMVPNVALVRALRALAENLGIPIRHGLSVIGLGTGLSTGGTSSSVTLSDGSAIAARLLIACDGARSRLRALAGIRTVEWDYGQSGIVATVEHERPHHGTAEEHFLPAGPFAILPLTSLQGVGNRSSLVWTERSAEAGRLVAADELVFEEELLRRFGHRLGELRVTGRRYAFPLGLTLSRAFVAPRLALAGDAAHRVHPISGQGLNLGFKDVAALAETVVEADRLGLDIGALHVLECYQSWRRFDAFRMGVTTDVLNRLFSNDITPVRALRDFGLGVVDRLPRLKDLLIAEAKGRTGKTAPRLLAGQPI